MTTAHARHLTAVRRRLASYAERGILRAFEEKPLPGGRAEFLFCWNRNYPIRLLADPARGSLTLRDLLPGVAPRSAFDRELRRFVQSRHERKLSPARRIDPVKIETLCVNRGGLFSIRLRVRRGGFDYAAKQALALAQEIWHYLSAHQPEYLCEVFDEPEE